MQGFLPLTFTRNHLYAKKARGAAVWRLGDTKQRGTRSAVRKQVQRWTRGQGLNRRGGGGSTGKFIFEPFGEFGMLWYCKSTLIGRRVVVMLPPRGDPLWRGEGAAREVPEWRRGRGPGTQWYAPMCIAPPPLLIAIGPTFSAGRYKPV